MKTDSILKKIHDFTETLDRSEFYNFYSLVTAMAGPVCGDYLCVNGRMINLKKIVRRIRITIMYPRFEVDYAKGYSDTEEISKVCDELTSLYNHLTSTEERQSVAKIISALNILADLFNPVKQENK